MLTIQPQSRCLKGPVGLLWRPYAHPGLTVGDIPGLLLKTNVKGEGKVLAVELLHSDDIVDGIAAFSVLYSILDTLFCFNIDSGLFSGF